MFHAELFLWFMYLSVFYTFPGFIVFEEALSEVYNFFYFF